MKRNRIPSAIFAPLSLSLCALGCGEDVGRCEDEERGRRTVVVGTQVQYGGQAIINSACASCHGSEVTGENRRGAPAGLDFDLYPIEEGETGQNDDGDTIVALSAAEVAGLRERQRKVFEERNAIWQQVKDGLMPPDGIGAAFRRLSSIFSSDEDTPCTKARNGYADISAQSSQSVLRNWLACGAPIVESNSSVVEKNGVAGQAGYQYKSCELDPGDAGVGDGGEGGVAITIETIQSSILDAKCTSCHSEEGGYEPDLGTADKSYAVLVEDTSDKCDGKPFVTPGNVEDSFFYDKISKDEPGSTSPEEPCGDRMPIGPELSNAEITLIRNWIAGGALREASLRQSKSLGPIGIDAGVR